LICEVRSEAFGVTESAANALLLDVKCQSTLQFPTAFEDDALIPETSLKVGRGIQGTAYLLLLP
jgi:hypothetical protein